MNLQYYKSIVLIHSSFFENYLELLNKFDDRLYSLYKLLYQIDFIDFYKSETFFIKYNALFNIDNSNFALA